MKQLIFITLFLLFVVTVRGQEKKKITFATTIGTGIAVSKPASTPFTWQVLGYYPLSERLSIGAGTGISSYEKILIPVYGDVKYQLSRSRLFTPYLECGTGYAFAPDKKANGGFYFYPSVGLSYNRIKDLKFQFALGYEIQKLSRVKTSENNVASSQFEEKLNHHTLMFRLGLLF